MPKVLIRSSKPEKIQNPRGEDSLAATTYLRKQLKAKKFWLRRIRVDRLGGLVSACVLSRREVELRNYLSTDVRKFSFTFVVEKHPRNGEEIIVHFFLSVHPSRTC